MGWSSWSLWGCRGEGSVVPIPSDISYGLSPFSIYWSQHPNLGYWYWNLQVGYPISYTDIDKIWISNLWSQYLTHGFQIRFENVELIVNLLTHWQSFFRHPDCCRSPQGRGWPEEMWWICRKGGALYCKWLSQHVSAIGTQNDSTIKNCYVWIDL